MVICYIKHEARKYLRRNRETQAEEIITVNNRNNLPVEKHIEMLNLNDNQYEYIDYLGISRCESKYVNINLGCI